MNDIFEKTMNIIMTIISFLGTIIGLYFGYKVLLYSGEHIPLFGYFPIGMFAGLITAGLITTVFYLTISLVFAAITKAISITTNIFLQKTNQETTVIQPIIEENVKQNWITHRIKKYPLLAFTFVFLFFNQFTTVIIFQTSFIELYEFSIWTWLIIIPVIYFLAWLLVVHIANKLPQEKLQQKILKHPIATIIMLILFITDLPYRLAEYGSNGGWFETILFFGYINFLWWLLICWISTKIFKKTRFQWRWYKKTVEKALLILPIAYKTIFSLILAILVLSIIFILFIRIYQYF